MIDKGQWGEFGQDTGVTPLLFTRSAMGFLISTESQDLGLMSHPKDGAFWQHSVPVRTHTDTGWAPPAGLINSNLVFPRRSPIQVLTSSTLLSFSGQPVLGCREIWLWCFKALSKVLANFLPHDVKYSCIDTAQSVVSRISTWLHPKNWATFFFHA